MTSNVMISSDQDTFHHLVLLSIAVKKPLKETPILKKDLNSFLSVRLNSAYPI